MSRKYVTELRGEAYFTPNGNCKIKDEPATPRDEEDGDYNNGLDFSLENDSMGMKKSMSMNDIAGLRDYMKWHSETDTSSCNGQRRQSQQLLQFAKEKFVSMAEAIYHYQRDTPNRFHSSRPQIFRPNGPVGRLGLTRPQSPMLRCKSRSRPLHVISQKEKEEQEIEEMKKHQVKAHPIPKSVIEGSMLPEVPKKPVTVPEPFNLTKIPKKILESPKQVLKFEARPAPKHILEKPCIPVRLPVHHVAKACSPKLHYKNANDQHKLEKKSSKTVNKSVRHGPIRPEPFSFEKRDVELKKRKEERIKCMIEEEKKQASIFKAQPLPDAVKKHMHSVASKVSTSSNSSENKENQIKFVAKLPTVLSKEPYKPVLQPLQIIKPVPFNLTTEKRAAEREKFDKQLKEKEEEQERIRIQIEKEFQEAEEKAKASLRAKLIHHAKPVPDIAPFVPEKGLIPLTEPETPKFVRRLQKK